MNISDSELAALSAIFNASGQSNTTGLQNSVLSQMWTVVVLQRTGDALGDPYRTITSFSTKAKAQTFAATLKFTDTQDAVILFQGTTLDSVLSGSQALSDVYCARAGVSHPAPTATEIAAVGAEIVKAKPQTLVKRAKSARDNS